MKHFELKTVMPRADMKHYPMKISEGQRANLKQLADYLDSKLSPIGFEMSDYLMTKMHCIDYASINTNCGTVGCLAGHGPLAGVEPRENENWGLYSMRVFTNANGSLSSWLFGGAWSATDNTVKGGIARIRYALAHGVPENQFDQQYGNVALCY